MMNRDESLERLKDRLTESQLRKVMTQGYTDVSLSVMAEYNTEYARMLASCKYSPQTFNKITAAYSQKRLPEESYLMIMDHARYSDRNEPYADAFLDSLNTIYPKAAANCFAAINYDEMSYHDAVSYVQTGAFYATDQASLSVTNEVAQELYDLHVPLRGCEGFNHCYDVDDLQASLNDGDAIFVQEKEFAVVVHNLMKQPEWADFKEKLQSLFSDMSGMLPSVTITELWEKEKVKQLRSALQDKMEKEHSDFLQGIREKSPDDIISSAYAIVAVDQIMTYMREIKPALTQEKYKALLSSDNALMEVYDAWTSHGDWNSMDEIGYAMENAAEDIQYSLARKKEEIIQKPPASLSPKEPEQKQKPKHIPKR